MRGLFFCHFQESSTVRRFADSPHKARSRPTPRRRRAFFIAVTAASPPRPIAQRNARPAPPTTPRWRAFFIYRLNPPEFPISNRPPGGRCREIGRVRPYTTELRRWRVTQSLMAHDPPTSLEEVRQRDWPETAKDAWRVLHEARSGDLVLFADRAQALEVERRWTDDEGLAHLEVAGPKGGSYQVNERYGQHGEPKFSSDIGRATDLHWVERQPLPRGLTEQEYEDLVQSLADQAVDAYVRMDYDDFWTPVEDIVEDWVDAVAYQNWPGYDRDEWQEGDAEAIYRSVLEHADALPDVGGPHNRVEETPRNQAEVVLAEEVHSVGKPEAEAQLIHDASSYNDIVTQLAHSSVERYERKSYSSARNAVRDTVSNFIDNHSEVVYTSILDNAPAPVDDELYDGYEMGETVRERAFDTLDRDVWDTVSAIQRNRNEHDPTTRGLTREQYMDLVDHLVEETLRHHGADERSGLIRTTAADQIEAWAESVEAHEWEGHRHRVWAADDPEDIFASVVMHGNSEPITLNPLAGNAERKMAEQVLLADVSKAADTARDKQDPKSEPIPADEYLQQELGIDMTYAELQDEDPDSVDDFLLNVVESLEGDEMGWTFVDELVSAGGLVPHLTNEWVLVDYGIVSEGQRHRRLAWFHRETGDVLVMSGMADGPPEDDNWGYDEFTVARLRYLSDGDPDFLLSDAEVDEALRFVYDYMGADTADMEIIESPNGDKWVIDAIEETDINTGGVMDALVPNFSIPGPDLTEADLFTVAEGKMRGMARFTRRWSTEIKSMAAFGVLSLLPYRVSKHLAGVRVSPNIHKKNGVGLEFSYHYGADRDEEGVGGKMEADVNVRKKTLSKWGGAVTPNRLKEMGGPDSSLRHTVESGVDAQNRLSRRWRRIAYPFDMEMVKPEGDDLTRDYDDYDDLAADIPTEQEYEELRLDAGEGHIAWPDFIRLRAYMYENDIHPDDAYPRADHWNRFWREFDETPEWSWSREVLSYFNILDSNGDDLPGWDQLTEGMADYNEEQFYRLVADEVGEDYETVKEWSDSNDGPSIKDKIGDEKMQELRARAMAADDGGDWHTTDHARDYQAELVEENPDAFAISTREARQMDRDDFEQLVEDAEDDLASQTLNEISSGLGPGSKSNISWADIEGESVPLGNIFLRGLNAKETLQQGSKRLPIDDWSVMGKHVLPEIEKPSFAAWREKRYGPDTTHDEKPNPVEQRARYYNAQEDDKPLDPHEVMGTSATADEQAMGAISDDPDAQGDYNESAYYGAEFGDSFEDVSEKFNRDGLDQEQGDVFESDGATPGNPPLSESDDMQPAAGPVDEDDSQEGQ